VGRPRFLTTAGAASDVVAAAGFLKVKDGLPPPPPPPPLLPLVLLLGLLLGLLVLLLLALLVLPLLLPLVFLLGLFVLPLLVLVLVLLPLLPLLLLLLLLLGPPVPPLLLPPPPLPSPLLPGGPSAVMLWRVRRLVLPASTIRAQESNAPCLRRSKHPPTNALTRLKSNFSRRPGKSGSMAAWPIALVRGNLVPHQLFDMVLHLIACAPFGRAQIRGRRRRRRRAGRGGWRDRIRILGSATRRGQRSRRSGTGHRPLGRLQLALQAQNLLALLLNDGLVRFVAGVGASGGM